MTTKTQEELSTWERYSEGTNFQSESPELPLGPWTSYSLRTDPIHTAFVLARYKFCARMLAGKKYVVEIGCGDGFGIPLVAQFVSHLHCIDWDLQNVKNCQRRLSYLKNVSFECIDLNASTLDIQADAAYAIDVVEHLHPELEAQFMKNVCHFLKPSGVLITGTPNITASAYASPQSVLQHINLKSMQTLRQLHETYFKHAFMFGMNDEVLHTGYASMCHYIWALAAEKK